MRVRGCTNASRLHLPAYGAAWLCSLWRNTKRLVDKATIKALCARRRRIQQPLEPCEGRSIRRERPAFRARFLTLDAVAMIEALQHTAGLGCLKRVVYSGNSVAPPW